jgi:hypothetical protein
MNFCEKGFITAKYSNNRIIHKWYLIAKIYKPAIVKKQNKQNKKQTI